MEYVYVTLIILLAFVALLAGAWAGYFLRQRIAEKKLGLAEVRAEEIVQEAMRQAEALKKNVY